MRVTSVQKENNSKPTGVLKAGAIGAISGALVRNFAPLTTEEHNFYFNESARNAIQEKVRKVRMNEITRIKDDFALNNINISKEAYDVFEKSTDAIVEHPKNALDIVKDAGDSVKAGFKSLVQRVDAVSSAKEHIEISNIKSAAKSSRPLAYFVIAGVLIAMSAQLLVDMFNKVSPNKEADNKKPSNEPMTMADILLTGAGSNSEIFFLAGQTVNKK